LFQEHPDEASAYFASAKRVSPKTWNATFGAPAKAARDKARLTGTGRLVMRPASAGATTVLNGSSASLPSVPAGWHLVQLRQGSEVSFARFVRVDAGAEVVLDVGKPAPERTSVSGSSDYLAQLEALKQARAEREDSARRRAAAEALLAQERELEAKRMAREEALIEELERKRAAQLQAAKDDVKREATTAWEATLPLLEERGPETRMLVTQYIETFDNAVVVFEGEEHAVSISEVVSARGWLDHSDATLERCMPPSQQTTAFHFDCALLLAEAGDEAGSQMQLCISTRGYGSRSLEAVEYAQFAGIRCSLTGRRPLAEEAPRAPKAATPKATSKVPESTPVEAQTCAAQPGESNATADYRCGRSLYEAGQEKEGMRRLCLSADSSDMVSLDAVEFLQGAGERCPR